MEDNCFNQYLSGGHRPQAIVIYLDVVFFDNCYTEVIFCIKSVAVLLMLFSRSRPPCGVTVVQLISVISAVWK